MVLTESMSFVVIDLAVEFYGVLMTLMFAFFLPKPVINYLPEKAFQVQISSRISGRQEIEVVF